MLTKKLIKEFLTLIKNGSYQKTNFSYGVFVGKVMVCISHKYSKDAFRELTDKSYNLSYISCFEDAEEQLKSLFETGNLIRPNSCDDFIWRGGKDSIDLKDYVFIDDDEIKTRGWSNTWYNNPKYHWEFRGTDKYGRTAFDRNFKIKRGLTMGEFYGNSPVD